jgi:hypothetical protein
MSRSISILILVLLAATPGPTGAQSATTAAWTIASGEYTIYGHTDYSPAIVVIPRLVWDTTHGLDSARAVDSVRPTPKPPDPGLAAGMSSWPEELYCSGATSAAMQPLGPRDVVGRLQLAARCGMRLVIVPPRRFLTASGKNPGIFSVDSARRLMDRYAEVLPADTLGKYRAVILGFNLGDDYGCTECWGGRAISQAEIAAWADYARARLPGVALGVRVEPSWVAAYPALAPKLDYAWAQYHTKKGDAKAYYDAAAATAQRLGIRVVMGVNLENCYGPDTPACSAADLTRFGTLAVTHPASCGFLSWRYEPLRWEDPAVRAAWEGLVGLARGRRAAGCGRA